MNSDKDRYEEGIRVAYHAGDSTRTIARVIGVSHVTVCRWLSSYGVRRRPARSTPRAVEMIGRRFGKLMVLDRVEGAYPATWVVMCDCGKTAEYTSGRLREIKSCGCAPRGPRPGRKKR